MGALYWIRIARKFTGLGRQTECPNLEALIEAEHGKPGNDYRIAGIAVPISVGAFGFASCLLAAYFGRNPLLWLWVLPVGILCAGLWLLFQRLDANISPARKAVRQKCEELTKRICGLSNIVGVEPALTPEVSNLLDEAAAIYIKHLQPTQKEPFRWVPVVQPKPNQAIEQAMARILDLGIQPSAAAQDLELSRGWAQPLLQEMRELDRALDAHMQASLDERLNQVDDPLARLREARAEIQGYDKALGELEQRS